MPHTPQPPPEANERPAFETAPANTGDVESFAFGDFSVAVEAFLGTAAALRLQDHCTALMGDELRPEDRVTVTQAANLLRLELSPHCFIQHPLDLREAQLSVTGQTVALDPLGAMLHPLLAAHAFPTFAAFLEATLSSATPRAPTPIRGVTFAETEHSRGVVVHLQFSEAPNIEARLFYGNQEHGYVTRAVDVPGPALVALGLLARALPLPALPDDPIHAIQGALAASDASDAVKH